MKTALDIATHDLIRTSSDFAQETKDPIQAQLAWIISNAALALRDTVNRPGNLEVLHHRLNWIGTHLESAKEKSAIDTSLVFVDEPISKETADRLRARSIDKTDPREG